LKILRKKNYNNIKISVQEESIARVLNQYKAHQEWCNRHFTAHSYFYYDNIDSIEEYILNLDFMQDNPNGTWKDMFGQSFAEFNTYHNLLQIRPALPTENKIAYNMTALDPKLRENYLEIAGEDWPNVDSLPVTLPDVILDENIDINKPSVLDPNKTTIYLSEEAKNFLNNNRNIYSRTVFQLSTLKGTGLVGYSIPRKSTLLQEKIALIKNFDECLAWYNKWVSINSFGKEYSLNEINQLCDEENSKISTQIETSNKQSAINEKLNVPLLSSIIRQY
jgi:hypothetical protein